MGQGGATRELGATAPLRALARGHLDDLAPAELRVLRLMAAGYTNTGIAEQLVLSPRTVECHISRILLKLGLRWADSCHRRVAAVLIYLQESQDGERLVHAA